MALPKMTTKNATLLSRSLKQLSDITRISYNDDIAPVALSLWEKHLKPDNPQWKHVSFQPIYINEDGNQAHVLAMVDSRLPGMGLVGYFACTNSEVGARVLRSATEWLHKKYGLKDMYGPINGTLPNDYRLNLQDTFSFPGEPVNPLWYVDAFREAGFEVFNKYVSGITKHYKLLVKLTARKPKKGYRHLTTRAFDNEKHNQDFKIYHDLRNAIFPHMSIYCPAISLEERKYNSSGKFDPRYCYFLLDGSEPVGFIMAYIYKNQLIVKTIGLLEAYRGKNLSGQLVRIVHAQAGKEGIEAAIYGMVRVGNAVYKSRRPGVKLFRHYVTMHKSM